MRHHWCSVNGKSDLTFIYQLTVIPQLTVFMQRSKYSGWMDVHLHWAVGDQSTLKRIGNQPTFRRPWEICQPSKSVRRSVEVWATVSDPSTFKPPRAIRQPAKGDGGRSVVVQTAVGDPLISKWKWKIRQPRNSRGRSFYLQTAAGHPSILNFRRTPPLPSNSGCGRFVDLQPAVR